MLPFQGANFYRTFPPNAMRWTIISRLSAIIIEFQKNSESRHAQNNNKITTEKQRHSILNFLYFCRLLKKEKNI
jgi:hypothetical protein